MTSKLLSPIFFVIFLFVSLGIFLIQGCELEEDVVQVNNPIYAPTGISVIDANPLNRVNIKNVKITLIDPDSLVVASSGLDFESVVIEEGIMNVGLKENPDLNSENPYRFRLRAEAEGYISNMVTVLIDKDTSRFVPIFLAKVETPPPGFAATTGAIPVSNTGVITNATVLETSTNPGMAQKIKVSIQEGTQLLCAGEVPQNVQGDVSFNLSVGSPTNVDAGRVFPNGFTVFDAVDVQGAPLATPNDPFFFFSAGWLTLDMTINGTEQVDGFDQPLRAEIEINDSLINRATNEPYQVGDTIPLWSLSDNDGIWAEESFVVIGENESGLVANFPVPHLSTWNIDNKDDPCGAEIEIEVFNDGGPTGPLYSELVEANTGAPFGITSIGTNGSDRTFSYADGATTSVTYSRAPTGLEVAFVIYDNTSPDDVLATSDMFTTCNSPSGTPDVTIEPTATLPQVTLRLQINVGDAAVDPICSNALWYKACTNCGLASCTSIPFQYAGHMDGTGVLTTPLEISQAHCMRIWYLGRDAADMVVESSIEFVILLEDGFNDANVLQSTSNTNVDFTYLSATDEYVIDISGGLTDVDTCLD